MTLLGLLLFPALPLAATVEPPCATAGCSGELCVRKGEEAHTMSACVWSGEFDCYTYYGVCKLLENGQCGWEENYDFQQCLKHHKTGNDGALTPYREDERFKTRRP